MEHKPTLPFLSMFAESWIASQPSLHPGSRYLFDRELVVRTGREEEMEAKGTKGVGEEGKTMSSYTSSAMTGRWSRSAAAATWNRREGGRRAGDEG